MKQTYFPGERPSVACQDKFNCGPGKDISADFNSKEGDMPIPPEFFVFGGGPHSGLRS
jgi:hypothetical protein